MVKDDGRKNSGAQLGIKVKGDGRENVKVKFGVSSRMMVERILE